MSDPKSVLDSLRKRMGPDSLKRLEEFHELSMEDRFDLLFLGALETATNLQWVINKFNQ